MDIPNTIKLIICDFDGTLVKLDVDWQAIKDDLNDQFTTDEFDNLDRGLRRLRMVSEEEFNKICVEITKKEIDGYAGVNQELLDDVRKVPYFAIFSSNTRQAVYQLTRRTEFRGLCPFIVGKEDVRKGKPSPQGLMKILWWFGCTAKEALYIGNSEDDREAGEKAGIKTIIVE